ncbi:energy transducer TonB [candidate division WOR-3 bacterium]|nr:energy transducer TonB [candidate division WOR-3 bacterium]
MNKAGIGFFVALVTAVTCLAGEAKVVKFTKVQEKPELITEVKPEYPEEARREGYEGIVFVEALVSTDGTIAEAKLVQSSGYESLDKAALDAAVKWTFTPAEHRGKPVKVWVSIPFNFLLGDWEPSETDERDSLETSTPPQGDTTAADTTADTTDIWNLDLRPLIKPLEVVKRAEALYPEELQNKGYEGTVLVTVLIDTEGKVEEAKVARSSGYAELDEAALEAAKKFEFNPPQHVSGTPIKVEGTLTFTFSLEESESE